MIEMTISTPPIVGVPGFLLMRLRPFFANMLADLKLRAACAMNHGPITTHRNSAVRLAKAARNVTNRNTRNGLTYVIKLLVKQVVKHQHAVLQSAFRARVPRALRAIL